VDWGRDVEESDRANAEVKCAAKKTTGGCDGPTLRLKRQDMGDSADSRFLTRLHLVTCGSI